MRNALLLIAILAFSGCSASETHLVPAIPVQQDATRSAMSSSAGFISPLSGALHGEVFKSRHVQVNAVNCATHDSEQAANFNASGNVAGPYQGTFTAKGSWKVFLNWNNDKWEWSLNESFSISSGSSYIAGTISGAGKSYNLPPISCHEFGHSSGRGVVYQVQGEHKGLVSPVRIRTDYLRESFH